MLAMRIATGRRGVPDRGDRAGGVVLGVTEALGDADGEEYRLWFRCRYGALAGTGDVFGRRDVVCEAREPHRARERMESATGIYFARQWTLVDGPRKIEVSDPPVEQWEIRDGRPLQEWAIAVVDVFIGAT